MTKPMIRVNGVLVPMHETVAPKPGIIVYVADPCHPVFRQTLAYATLGDEDLLRRGLIYLNAEDAAARGRAMLLWEKVE